MKLEQKWWYSKGECGTDTKVNNLRQKCYRFWDKSTNIFEKPYQLYSSDRYKILVSAVCSDIIYFFPKNCGDPDNSFRTWSVKLQRLSEWPFKIQAPVLNMFISSGSVVRIVLCYSHEWSIAFNSCMVYGVILTLSLQSIQKAKQCPHFNLMFVCFLFVVPIISPL